MDGASSLSEERLGPSNHTSCVIEEVAKLSAGHNGVRLSPAIVTNCSPFFPETNLNTALIYVSPAHQPKISVVACNCVGGRGEGGGGGEGGRRGGGKEIKRKREQSTVLYTPEMPFPMISLFAEISYTRFWLTTI